MIVLSCDDVICLLPAFFDLIPISNNNKLQLTYFTKILIECFSFMFIINFFFFNAVYLLL